MLRSDPEISILMPLHNAAAFIEETIHSVLKQRFEQWELIIVDDFSTDHSVKIVERLASNDSRINIIPNTEKGIIPALQTAFEKSRGVYITRMDADDLMPDEKLMLFRKAIEGTEKTVVTGRVSYFAETTVSEGYQRYEGWLNALVKSEKHWAYIYRECVIASPNWMVERTCFESCFGFKTLTYPEDYDMVFKWYEQGFKVKGIDEVTHLWREHPDRTSRNVEAYQQAAFFDLKTSRFVDIEWNEKEKIQLIGAGQKGKMVATVLNKRNVPFDWFDLKAEKFTAPLFGKDIQPVAALSGRHKTILTVWPVEREPQAAVQLFLASKGLVLEKNCYLF